MNSLEEQLTATKLRVMELESNLSSKLSSRLMNDSFEDTMRMQKAQDYHNGQHQQEGVDKLAWLTSASDVSASLVHSTIGGAKRRSFDSTSSSSNDQDSYADGMFYQVNKKHRVA